MANLLKKIRIVLVETSHPGNIGGVARAMKNMKLDQLYLVSPNIFPSADATSRASGADEILAAAKICDSLQEAISDCTLVFGASARDRTLSWPVLAARECAEKIVSDGNLTNVAIVFGRENSGLTNQELDLCHFLLRIPCNPAFSSLNLAAAVQVVGYELFVASEQRQEHKLLTSEREALATSQQLELFYQHLHQALIDIGFMHPDKSKSIMRRLRRIYNRTRLDTKEVDILRGILRMSQGNKCNE